MEDEGVRSKPGEEGFIQATDSHVAGARLAAIEIRRSMRVVWVF